MNDCLGVNNTRDESQNLCDVIYLDLYGQKAHIIGWLSMEKIVKFTSKFDVRERNGGVAVNFGVVQTHSILWVHDAFSL
jgi:hypothetical protein